MMRNHLNPGKTLINMTVLYITVGIVFILITAMNIYAYRTIRTRGRDFTNLGVLSKNLRSDLETAYQNLNEIILQGKRKDLQDHVFSYLEKAQEKVKELNRITKLQLDGNVEKFGKLAQEAYSEKTLEKKKQNLELCYREVKNAIARLAASDEERSALINNEISFIGFIFAVLLIGNLLAFAGIFFVIFVNDRTFKAKEKRLNSENANFHAIMQGLDSILISFDSDGTIQTWNNNAERYFDLTQDELVGQNIYEKVPVFQQFKAFFDKVLYSKQRHYNYHERMHVNKGPTRIVDMLCVPIISAGGGKKEQKALLVKMDDVTSFATAGEYAVRVRSSELVSSAMENVVKDSSAMHNQTIEAVQTLNEISAMHGIADEIAPYTAYLNNMLNEQSMIPQKYASTLRAEEMNNIHLDLNELIMYTLRICLKTFDPCINVEVSQNESKSWIMADPIALSRALFCLLNNAAEAMTEMRQPEETQGGIISVSVEKIEGEKIVCDKVMRFRHAVKEPPYWVILISDTGVGIPTDIQPSIFDMFFTTKNPEQHKGLGLSLVADIINGLGGFFDVNSKPGHGSVFKIYLPEVVGMPEEMESEEVVDLSSNDADIVNGHGTVLLISDDIFMRQITEKLIRKFGYNVLSSENAFEALDIYAQDINSEERAIQCVVSNLSHGIIRNVDLVSNLKQMDPEAGVVVLVRSGQNEEIQQLTELGVTHFVRKPYTMPELSQALAQYCRDENEQSV